MPVKQETILRRVPTRDKDEVRAIARSIHGGGFYVSASDFLDMVRPVSVSGGLGDRDRDVAVSPGQKAAGGLIPLRETESGKHGIA